VLAVPVLALGLAGIVLRRARHRQAPDETPPEADGPRERPAPGREPRADLG
jgi:hypothetical protein